MKREGGPPFVNAQTSSVFERGNRPFSFFIVLGLLFSCLFCFVCLPHGGLQGGILAFGHNFLQNSQKSRHSLVGEWQNPCTSFVFQIQSRRITIKSVLIKKTFAIVLASFSLQTCMAKLSTVSVNLTLNGHFFPSVT